MFGASPLIDETSFYLWPFMHTYTVSPYIMYTINQNNLTAVLSPFSLSSSVLPSGDKPSSLSLYFSLSHTHYHRPLLTILLSTITYLLFERTQFFAVQLFYPSPVILHTQPISGRILQFGELSWPKGVVSVCIIRRLLIITYVFVCVYQIKSILPWDIQEAHKSRFPHARMQEASHAAETTQNQSQIRLRR